MSALGYNLYWHCNFMHFYKYRCQAYCTCVCVWGATKNDTMGTVRRRHNWPAADQTSKQVISFYALAVTFQTFPPSTPFHSGICMDIGNCKYTRVRLQLIIIQLHSVCICKKIFIFASQFFMAYSINCESFSRYKSKVFSQFQ